MATISQYGIFHNRIYENNVYKSLRTHEHEQLLALLRDTRRRAGLRQVELSKRLKKPQSFVSKYESGERRLDFIELRQICKALGIGLPAFIRRFERML